MIALTPAKHLKAFFSLVVFALLALTLSACTSGALSPGLSARMDAPGASLDRAEALNLINQYRASRSVAALSPDEGLNAIAQTLAAQYATNGTLPAKPENGVVHMRISAGYANFAETFSGWRSSTADANAIADPGASRAGLGVAFAPNSTYGVHWVLLLASPVAIAAPAPIPAPVPAQ